MNFGVPPWQYMLNKALFPSKQEVVRLQSQAGPKPAADVLLPFSHSLREEQRQSSTRSSTRGEAGLGRSGDEFAQFSNLRHHMGFHLHMAYAVCAKCMFLWPHAAPLDKFDPITCLSFSGCTKSSSRFQPFQSILNWSEYCFHNLVFCAVMIFGFLLKSPPTKEMKPNWARLKL